MEMQRVLIADTQLAVAEAIAKRLKGKFLVEICSEGEKVLELVAGFEPDILMLALDLPGCCGLDILQNLRASGRSTEVIVMLTATEPWIMKALASLGIRHALRKPFSIGSAAARVCAITSGVYAEEDPLWCPENEIDITLLNFGFQMGPGRYKCVCEGILLWYRAKGDMVSKQLYPEVARICGGSSTRVEKAIRDAIQDAWKHGDKSIWQLYFPPGKGGVMRCPSNEVFIARVARSLLQRQRMRRPYEKAQ